MKELHLGKIKSAEVAEWLGVTYGTFRNTCDKQLKKLDGYCEYTKVWGGIEVTKIYCPVYKGELKVDMVKDILNEITEHPISTASGMARKFKNECRPQYAQYDGDSLKNALTKAARTSFGKIQKQDAFKLADAGVCGYRYGTWAIKLSQYNEYRELTDDEWQIFKDVVAEVCHKKPEKVIDMYELVEDLRHGDLTAEEFIEEHDKRSNDLFSACLREFADRTGLTLVRCSNHHKATYEEMQELEKTQLGAFESESVGE